MTSAQGLVRSRFRNRTYDRGQGIVVSAATGLTTSFATGITCADNEVALVTKVVFYGLTNDAATNVTITMKVNGIELPFHFAGKADVRQSKRRVWRTNGNLCVHPQNTLQVKASAILSASVEIHYRRMTIQQAYADGLLGGGSLPNVASTNAITTGGLTADTAKKIINNTNYDGKFIAGSAAFTIGETLTFSGGATARLIRISGNGTTTGTMTWQLLTGTAPVADETLTGGTSSSTATISGTPSSNTSRVIQILGFAYTGHNYNASEDTARIGFWDGSTGTFASNANHIFKVYAQGVDNRYAPEILVGDTQGCIQGTAGLHVYVDATTNLAGATPTGDFVVLYRYIDAADTVNTTGAIGSSTGGRKFWLLNTASVTPTTGVPQLFFGSSIPTASCRILGQAASYSSIDDAAPHTMGLGLGTSVATLNVTGMALSNSDAAASPAAVSASFVDEDVDLTMSTAFQPGFAGQNANADRLHRAHLVWGFLGGDVQTGSSPANVTRLS